MSEKVLLSLIRFYAVFLKTDTNIELELAQNFIITFLQKQFNPKMVEKYTAIFCEYYTDSKTSAYSSVAQDQFKTYFSELIVQLPFKQRIYLIINLLTFSSFVSTLILNSKSNTVIGETINKIALLLNIDSYIFSCLKYFVNGEYHKILDNNNFLIVSSVDFNQKSKVNKHTVKNLKGQFFALRFDFDFCLICYQGESKYYLNDKLILPGNIYVISYHTGISSDEIPTIYYNEILKSFLNSYQNPEIKYELNNIEFNFNNKLKGIHPLSMECRQNELVGIIGNSGVGKSTLLKLLAGIYPLHGGEIKINNKSLLNNRDDIKGLLGYIPQEEILFENLTVYENILFHAKLSMKILSDDDLNKKILELLENLGLYEVKDQKVGTVSKKIISGGERKRLNIALELIRNPYVLFIDEPTSGLSSSDAHKILNLLKQEAIKGKLIFINVHQPSDQVLHLFDKLIVMDKGGYPVYFGSTGNAYKYLVSKANIVSTQKYDDDYSESEKILELIEHKQVDEFGNSTKKRKIKPYKWYEYFREHQQKEETSSNIDKVEEASEKAFKTYDKPTKFYQFLIYLIRNYKTRIKDKSYIFISLFISPVLAMVLAFFCKQMIRDNFGNLNYIFSKNENIPSFIFMSVIVALFIGLMTSAEEIIKDKWILKKESFLGISSLSYIGSKVFYLFQMSLMQTLSYTLVSFIILKFNSGFLVFWASMFSISFIANILGLIISTIFKTTVSVYILIPFIIIPQILLSGVVIKFDNIHPGLTSQKYTPVISDIMPTRWAYELLMIDQFKNNDYQKNLFEVEKQISTQGFKILATIPELQDRIDELQLSKSDSADDFNNNVSFIVNELGKLGYDAENMNNNQFFDRVSEIESYLNFLKSEAVLTRDSLFAVRDFIFKELIEKCGGRKELVVFKEQSFNNNVAEAVLRKGTYTPYVCWENQLIQKTEPIYKNPDSVFGRAHLFSAIKTIGHYKISTIYFNFLVILTFSFTLSIILILLFRKKYKLL